MMLYTLHRNSTDHRIISARVCACAEDAIQAWGGQFLPRPGGMATSSRDPDELGICGSVRFGPELFREMDDIDIALAGSLPGSRVYTENGIALLASPGQAIELTLRQTHLAS